MKFKRTDEYNQKLMEQALFDDKRVITDAHIEIIPVNGKLKAYCEKTKTFLQFPRNIRTLDAEFIADIVEVIREDNIEKYYRVMKGSIRKKGSQEVIA